MTSFDFSIKTHGKWILAGEHSVLRGNPAIVFPLLGGKSLSLAYKKSNNNLDIHTSHGEYFKDLCFRFIKYLHDTLNIKIPNGIITIDNQIPSRSGLGASAAFCVAFVKLLEYLGMIQSNELYETAKQMEHFFHGQSSGLDIAGSLSNEAVLFQQGHVSPLKLDFKPCFILVHTNQYAKTQDCIEKVSQCMANRDLSIDKKMAEAVTMALVAMKNANLEQLARSIRMSHECFDTWGLIDKGMQDLIDDLYLKGAMAVKPTGSGLGGYLLTLWQDSEACTQLPINYPNHEIYSCQSI